MVRLPSGQKIVLIVADTENNTATRYGARRQDFTHDATENTLMTLVMVEPFLKLSRSTTLEVFNKEAVQFRLGAEEMPTTAGVASLLARLLCLYVKVVSFYLSVSVRPKSFLTVIFRLAHGVFSISKCWPSQTEQGPFAFPAPVLLCRVEPGCACDGPAPESGRACPASRRAAANTFFSRPLKFFSNICCV